MKTKLDKRSKYLRSLVIDMLDAGRRGHPGSAFSLVEILRVLYDDILTFKSQNQNWPARDRFILSKGHGCLALYAVLFDKGFISKKDLNEFCQSGALLGGHPDYEIPGVELSTGSLGHGLSVGVGMVVALRSLKLKVKSEKLGKKQPRVFVLISDGECNEGSTWEGILAAGMHKLDNLSVIVDYDRFQSYGFSREILNLEPFRDKWQACGFGVREIDGHNITEIRNALKDLPIKRNKPSVIICHTVKGKGFKFMENNPLWHHKRGITDEEIKLMREELNRD